MPCTVQYFKVILTSRFFEGFQSGSSCTQLDRDKDQSERLILRFLPTDQNSVATEIGDDHLDM